MNTSTAHMTQHEMVENESIVSHVLVYDVSAYALDKIKDFCDKNSLIGLRTQSDSMNDVLESNVHLGAVFLCEDLDETGKSGIEIAVEIHQRRPELPIFIRRTEVKDLHDLPKELQTIFAGAYHNDTFDTLKKLIDRYLFSLHYPEELVSGIKEMSLEVLHSSFKDMEVFCDTPYIVKDKIIYGELFSLMPIEASWCRGYMMLQTEERSMMDAIRAEKTQLSPIDPDFREVNTMLSEISNMAWGGFKSRFASGEEENQEDLSHRIQVPIIINHSHKYISFGSDEPQLCYRYTLVDPDGRLAPVSLYQKFVFSLSWSPEKFKVNQQQVDDLVDNGALELF